MLLVVGRPGAAAAVEEVTLTTPRHGDRERLHFSGVDVQDIVDRYVEKHWGESIRKTAAKYGYDDTDGKEMDEMENEAKRETTFDEVTGAFTPAGHIRRERRAERVQVAGWALEALIINVHMRRTDDPHTDAQKLADDALYYADALLARIDETEPKPEGDDPLYIKKDGELHPHKKPETSPGKQPVKVTMADFDWRNVQDLGETIARSINNLGDAVRSRVELDTDSHCPRCDRSTPCPRRTRGRKPLDTPPAAG